MVSEIKKKLVAELASLAKENPIVGVVNMENLPAPALQKMRATLREDVKILMAKKKLLVRALEASQVEGIKGLTEYFGGMPALLFTKENPFKLYKTLQKNKSPAPAKAGQTAPKDVQVKAGPTNFAPGPIIGELGSVGIKTGVEGGKLAIKEDSIVAKEGDVISAKLAGLLKRLGIEPMEIGLNMVAVFEKGLIYKANVLAIDEDKFNQDLSNAARWAVNLAVGSGIHTKDTAELMVVKAVRESRALAMEARILADGIASEIVTMAEREALSLKAEANVEIGAAKPAETKQEEKKEPEQPKEEIKSETPKEEAKPEEPTTPASENEEETKPETPKEEAKPEPAPEETKTEEAPKAEETSTKQEESTQSDAAERDKETPIEIQDDDALPQTIETAKAEEPEEKREPATVEQPEKLSGIKAALKKIEDLFSFSVEDAKKLEVTKNDEELAQKALDDLKRIDGELHESEPEVEELKAHIARLRAVIEARRAQPDTQKVEQLVEELQKKGTLRPEQPKAPERVPSAHELLEKKKQKDHLGGK